MPVWLVLSTAGLAVVLLWQSWVDLRSYRIPDMANLMIALLGIAVIALLPDPVLWQHLCAGVVGYLLFRAIGDILWYRLGQEALGQGDAKLLGAGMLWVGLSGLASVILFASLSGILFAFLRKNRQSEDGPDGIPFGPFLGTGIYIVWLYGPWQI